MMNREERFQLIDNELKEIASLIGGMDRCEIIPPVFIDMTVEKIERLSSYVRLLNPELEQNIPFQEIPRPKVAADEIAAAHEEILRELETEMNEIESEEVAVSPQTSDDDRLYQSVPCYGGSRKDIIMIRRKPQPAPAAEENVEVEPQPQIIFSAAESSEPVVEPLSVESTEPAAEFSEPVDEPLEPAVEILEPAVESEEAETESEPAEPSVLQEPSEDMPTQESVASEPLVEETVIADDEVKAEEPLIEEIPVEAKQPAPTDESAAVEEPAVEEEPVVEAAAQPIAPAPINIIVDIPQSGNITSQPPVSDVRQVEVNRPDTRMVSVDGGRQLADIRSQVSIIDRFLFQKELFRGDVGMMNYAFDEINKCKSDKEAFEFLKREFNWEEDRLGVNEIKVLIERHFKKKFY